MFVHVWVLHHHCQPPTNPDLVLQFKEQVINTSQTRLDYEKYFKYLNEERFA